MKTTLDELVSRKERLKDLDLFDRPEESEPPRHRVYLSVEGDKTERQYFTWLSDALARNYSVIITTLKQTKDNQNDPLHVLALLKEYTLKLDMRTLDKELLNSAHSRFNDEEIFDCLHNPSILDESTLHEIETFFNEHNYDVEAARSLLNLSDGDQLGIVIDRDCKSHSEKDLKDCYAYCLKRGWRFYLNTPCFEFWLYLHLIPPETLTPEFLRDAFLKDKDKTNRHTFISKKLSEIAKHNKSISRNIFNRYYLPNYKTALSNLKYCAHTIEELYNKAGSNLNELFDSLGIVGNETTR